MTASDDVVQSMPPEIADAAGRWLADQIRNDTDTTDLEVAS